MTLAHRRHPAAVVMQLAVVLSLALAAAACGPTAPSVTPAASPSAAATITAAPIASLTPIAGPTAAATPIASSSAATACVVTPQTGQLPSDRFTNLTVSAGSTTDRLTFVFGKPSLGSPAGPPQGSLEVAIPPYTAAGSGAPIEVIGEHVVQIRFSAMSLQNDAGQETYAGPPELKPTLPALRHAVLFDASEGIVGWYVGYDGPGCVTLARDGSNVTVTIDHP